MSELSNEYKALRIDVKVSMIARDFALLRHAIKKLDGYSNDILLNNVTDEEEVDILDDIKIENRDVRKNSSNAIKKIDAIQDILEKFIKNF